MKKKFILPFLLCGALLIVPSCGETVKEDDTNLDDNKTKQKMKAIFDRSWLYSLYMCFYIEIDPRFLRRATLPSDRREERSVWRRFVGW